MTNKTLRIAVAILVPALAVSARASAQDAAPNAPAAPETNAGAPSDALAAPETNGEQPQKAASLDSEIAELESQADPNALAAIDLYTKGDVDGAYQSLKKAYDANPDSDPPGVLLALLHSHAGRFLDMRRALEQTAEDYPSDPEAYLQLAGVDVQEGRFLEAQLLIERAEKLVDGYKEAHPETVTRLQYLKEEALSARANLAEKRERYDEALDLVKKVVELNPENAQARWNAGYLSMKLRDYDAAELAFDEAAKRNTELWPGWLQVASSLDREDLVEEAAARMAKHKDDVDKAPNDQRAQVARLYLRWNMLQEAAEIIEGFVKENNEKNIDRWILTGWLDMYANKFAAAEENFLRATIVDPENFEASNGLALALLDQSNKEKLARAKVIAAKNYHAYPDSNEAAVTYAWTLFLSGNQKEANEIFGPMLSSGKMTATVAYYIAEIANVRGDRDLARTLLKLAISQKANFPKRNAALELQALLDATEEKEDVDPYSDFDDEPTFGEETEKDAGAE